MVTLEQYLGPYAEHPDATPEVRERAAKHLDNVNDLIAHAKIDSVLFLINPHTECEVSGEGNGGFRPHDCKVGATSSTHKKGGGVDIYDQKREFARWCLRNLAALEELGLYMENPQWTPSWVHLQDVPPASGKRVYIPSATPALAEALPEQKVVA